MKKKPRPGSSEKTITDLRKAIQTVEEGLLSTMRIMGRPQQRMALSERMARYRVPGFSVALIHHDEIAWAGGYGVRRPMAMNR